MRAILGGSRLPDDATIPVQILYLLLTPVRLFRHRTAVNLVVSYVAMALITITLLILSIVTVVLWPRIAETFNVEEIAIDYVMGERVRAYAQWLDPELVATGGSNGIDADEQARLDAALSEIVAGSVPGFSEGTGGSIQRVAHAAIFDANGIVIATSDPEWLPVGASIRDIPLQASRTVGNRSLALQGTIDPTWGAQYSMAVSNERTAASIPFIDAEGSVSGYLLIEGNPLREVIGGQSRMEIFRYMVSQYSRLIWAFTLPAILVAIPFGVWRSRSISRRLERLATAADAMAEGDLDTRVEVRQRDEIGRLGDRFNQMAATIQSNDRIRRAFISNVSHELRTPITIIQGTVERQLDRQDRLSTDQVETYRVIHRESDMLGRMISDLFTLTRIDEQSLRLDRRAVDIHDIAAESTASIADLAWTQSRVSVESLVPIDLPPVLVDPTRIRQVLNNLLYNSLRHTPEGGLVVVQARLRGEMIDVSVSDTGRGIPADEIDHVFDRYYQAERGQRHDDGSGLGLSIVKQLIVAHGGEISVESKAGEGTTFRFSLPLAG